MLSDLLMKDLNTTAGYECHDQGKPLGYLWKGSANDQMNNVPSIAEVTIEASKMFPMT